jgi:hypothetical protein
MYFEEALATLTVRPPLPPRGGAVCTGPDFKTENRKNPTEKNTAPQRGSKSDNYHEQSYRCYPNDQKGPCGRVALEPMCVLAHEGHPR